MQIAGEGERQTRDVNRVVAKPVSANFQANWTAAESQIPIRLSRPGTFPIAVANLPTAATVIIAPSNPSHV